MTTYEYEYSRILVGILLKNILRRDMFLTRIMRYSVYCISNIPTSGNILKTILNVATRRRFQGKFQGTIRDSVEYTRTYSVEDQRLNFFVKHICWYTLHPYGLAVCRIIHTNYSTKHVLERGILFEHHWQGVTQAFAGIIFGT